MRQNPVAPVPPGRPEEPTRRAFLFGGVFAAGLTIGGTWGYAAGGTVSHTILADERGPDSDGDESTPDSDLVELRRLALEAPIEELVERRLMLLHNFSLHYRQDPTLWRGIERLVDETLNNPHLTNRRGVAIAVAQVVELGEPGLGQLIGDRLPRLKRLR